MKSYSKVSSAVAGMVFATLASAQYAPPVSLSVETPVGTIMTSPVVTVDEFTPADTVARLLRTHRVHHLPVTRQGVVVGLITPQEVIRYFVENELPVPPEVA